MSNNIIRFSFGKEPFKSIILDDTAPDIPVTTIKNEHMISCNGKTLLTLNAPSFEEYEITKNTSTESFTRETADGIKVSVKAGEREYVRKSRHAVVTLKITDGIMFGLGSHDMGYKCLNGIKLPLYQENLKISVPFFVSTAGFGCLIDNCSYMEYDNTEKNTVKIYVDCADNLDMYIMTGNIDEIHRSYRLLTGATPMLPKWACGYAQSKERYETSEELLNIVERYRELKVPLDLIVQDWQYWESGFWGQKSFDENRYNNVDDCIKKIHELGCHVMISIWPNMNGNGADQNEFLHNNLMLSDGSVYDAFNNNARDMYWEQAYEGLFRHGIDAWWCDSSEPYDTNWEGKIRPDIETGTRKAVAEYKKYIDDSIINVYSIYHAKGIYEHQKKVSDKRVYNLIRSGYAGQHRYGTVTWSGDICASWDTLEKQVYILQNYTSCGEAYWNCDIGGFFVAKKEPWFWNGQYDNGTEDNEYRELYTRWLQFAGFTMIMRSHGTDTPREIWNFGKPGDVYYDAIKKAIELRYSLMPFFYSIAARVSIEGIMPVKPLVMCFPEDACAAKVFDEYLYGDVLLICPITKPHITDKDIYLPEGLWYDYYTGKKYPGGRWHKITLTIDRIPVFAKAGAIIPTTEVMQYADEIKDAPIEVLVFGGNDGSFDLYDDAGDGYEYENGEYSLIHIEYNSGDGTTRRVQLSDRRFEKKLIFTII